MFIDLVGSTELSAQLDPEEMGDVLRAYQDAVAGAVARFEGHIAKLMGDGVLAYFGWPQAHEDEAERAVRAGLAVLGAVGRLRTPNGAALVARAGIATGLVVVGDLVGSGDARERAVIGNTPNLAARLQALAEPGTVVISETTRRLLGGLFDCAGLTPQIIKGFAEPVRAFVVCGELEVESRFEALHTRAVHELVGREQELALLVDRGRLAREGDGQVVVLSGGEGIGKSRIVLELRERLRSEPWLGMRLQCSPRHTNSALWPVMGQLERAAGIERDEPAEVKLAKLADVFTRVAPDAEAAVPLFAELLAIPAGGKHPLLPLSPQQKKRRIFETLLAHLEGLSRQQPVLMVLEDAHWLDPTTRDLFDLTVESMARLRVLLVVTARPEAVPLWQGHTHVTALALNRLVGRQVEALVAKVAGGKPLPAEVVEQIRGRTDGVPLFVEELTRAVLESGLLRDAGDGWVLDGPLPPFAIPATLHDSLMARLDRLAVVKEVAQVAACIGREFGHELLAAVAPLPEEQLHRALDQLVAAQLIFCRGTPPDAVYTFKHALVQDVAYQSLLKSRRQQLHAVIARALEARSDGDPLGPPEILAHHFTEAGLVEPATAWWLKAGQLAIDRSAYVEAVHHLQRGLEVLTGLPNTRERAARELRLWRALGAALAVVRGYPAHETGQAFERALALCHELEEDSQLFPVLFGLWVSRLNRGEIARGEEAAREFFERAERLADASLLLVGHTLVGSIHLIRGQFKEARTAYEQTISLYRPDQHRALAADYVTDRGVVGKQLLANALGPLGYWDLARQHTTEALGEACRLGHPATEAYALWLGMVLWQVMGEVDTVDEHAERLVKLAQELHAAYWLGIATVYRGWVQVARGGAVTAIPIIRDGITTFRATGAAYLLPHYMTLLAAAHRASGDYAAALAVLGEAEAEARRTGDYWSFSEVLRLQGEVITELPKPGLVQGEVCLRNAVEVTRAQKAKGWELRAATSLARLWRNQGRQREARDYLDPVYGWFTEGFDTLDLKEAKELLDEIRE
jgi:class 3 adenylate cyclase/predicted ATPase